MTRHSLTLAQHRAIGAQLYDMRNQLLYLSTWLGTTYTRDKMRYALQPLRRIDRVRSRLDDYVAEEHPRISYEDCANAYYPRRSPEEHDQFVAQWWRTWTVLKARQASILMARDLRLIADQITQAYPVTWGDRLLHAAEYVELISIHAPDWTPKRGHVVKGVLYTPLFPSA